MPFKGRIVKNIKWILGCAAVLFVYIAFFSKGVALAPKYALVTPDPYTGMYYSPGCTPTNLHTTEITIAQAKEKGLKPLDECGAGHEFSSEDRLITIWLGMDKKRWNSDGTWNW